MFFESQADNLDDPDEVPQPTAIAPHDDRNLPDSAETSNLPPAPSSHIPPPIPAPSACPSHTRRAPTCLEPADFGAYGHRNETVANAYEDLWNGNTLANVTILEDDLMMGLICNDAHLANKIIKQDTTLPDNPSLQDALAGPECDLWHAVILKELATIRDAGTWTLVDHTPNIRNIIGCHFVLQKKCSADGNITRFKACLVAQ